MTFPDEAAVERERIRKVLEQHRLIANICRCGFDARLDYHRYESHVAAALVAAASVPPEPAEDRYVADDVIVQGRPGEAGHRRSCDVVVEGPTWDCDCGASVPPKPPVGDPDWQDYLDWLKAGRPPRGASVPHPNPAEGDEHA